MVQMKVTASVLFIAGAIAPVVANGFEAEDSLVTRDDNELASYFERDFDLELEEREFHDDLFEREPVGVKFMKKVFRMGRKHGGSVTLPETPNDGVFERGFEEELYERARGGGSSSGSSNGHGGNGQGGSGQGSSSGAGGHGGSQGSSSAGHRGRKRREFTEELEERETRSFDELEILEREYHGELD